MPYFARQQLKFKFKKNMPKIYFVEEFEKMADFVFKLSSKVILGNYSLARIGEEVVKFGNNFMFVVDPFFEDMGLVDKVRKSLEEKNISTAFPKIVSEKKLPLVET